MEPRNSDWPSKSKQEQLGLPLLERLRSTENSGFEDLARRALANPNVDVDFVYPHPIGKTLLEIACCEGRADFVESILKLGANADRINVDHNRGPIHFAAEAGHADVLAILLKDKRADPNLEAGRQTGLHVAVRDKHAECVRVLLENGADPNIVNSKGITPIHVAAINGQRDIVRSIIDVSKFTPNIDDFRDWKNRTTRQILETNMPEILLPSSIIPERKIIGVADAIRATDEMQFLEIVEKFSDDGRSDHYDELIKIATKRNFVEAVGRLMTGGVGSTGIGCGTTNVLEAANIAIQLGHYRVLEEIFRFESNIANRLLLPACRELGIPTLGGCGSDDDRIKCLTLVLDQPEVNVRCEDEKGNTPLHYAARAESSQAVGMLLRAGSYIGHKNVLGVPPLAHTSPETLSDFFDDCLRADNDRTDDYEIRFDYRCLMPHNDVYDQRRRNDSNEENGTTKSVESTINPAASRTLSEMETLTFIASNRALKPLLKHPLLSSFLYLKWHRIRHVLYGNFVFYVIFYILINIYIVSLNYDIVDSENSNNSTTIIAPAFQRLNGLTSLATIFLVLLTIRETVQLLSSPLRYLSSLENLLELGLIFLGAWTIVTADSKIGAIVILLSAWELVILIGQHPRMSTGIEMFKTVSINFLRFLFLYAFLIVAFALAFFTLFKNSKDNNDDFPNPGRSLFKTIIMLTGEFDANDIPFASHPILSHCIFVLFVFLIAIVLFNLLNGLAVSDTADILNKSELVGLTSRTKLVSYAETVAVGSGFTRLTGRSNFNPLAFLARRIILFPGYLPQCKIGVKPYKSNKIRLYGRSKTTKNCVDWSMDPWIVTRARQLLTRRGEITDNEKIISQLDTIKHKLERLETVMDVMRLALENNNS